jgi:hypothetical protein
MPLDLKTTYDDSNAGTVADIISNGLFIFQLSNEATNTPTVNHNIRIRFIDN